MTELFEVFVTGLAIGIFLAALITPILAVNALSRYICKKLRIYDND